MNAKELTDYLESHDEWEWMPDDETPDKAILIRNLRFSTLTRVESKAVEDNGLDTILAACAQGRDVDHITRVTGYFSKTSGWNKGKAGELKDRHRSPV